MTAIYRMLVVAAWFGLSATALPAQATAKTDQPAKDQVEAKSQKAITVSVTPRLTSADPLPQQLVPHGKSKKQKSKDKIVVRSSKR